MHDTSKANSAKTAAERFRGASQKTLATLAGVWAGAFLFGASPAQAARHVVVIENMQFAPADMAVARGDEVVWINKDLVAHTATAKGAFDSRALAPGRSWHYIARKPGRYAYGCAFHPTMKATLVVGNKP